MKVAQKSIKQQIGFIFLLIFIVFALLLLGMYILWSMANEICIRSEVRPVRLESGFWGDRYVETTEQNADAYMKLCAEKENAPSFWSITKNINYIVEKQKNE